MTKCPIARHFYRFQGGLVAAIRANLPPTLTINPLMRISTNRGEGQGQASVIRYCKRGVEVKVLIGKGQANDVRKKGRGSGLQS